MSILSDREIRERCIVPTYVVTELVEAPKNLKDNSQLSYPRQYFSRESKEALQKKIDMWPGRGLPGVISMRYLTEDERDQFEPMIVPFEPKQIRYDLEDRMARAATLESAGKRLEALNLSYDGDEEANRRKVISYGLSSYGYDIRCSNEFKIFTNINSTVVDPKNFDQKNFVDVDASDNGGFVIIPPNSFALARTMEYFRIPRDILTVCLGKSTYARCGIIVNVTPFEPEWEGHVTLEFSNTTPLPAKIYAGEGCAQVLFFKASDICEVSYQDRGGKYQKQTGITIPRA